MNYREIAKAIRDPENQPHQFSDADLAQFFIEAADEIERLRAKYEEAIIDIEEWGAYASEYFQKKWDLKGCIEQHRAALNGDE